MRRYRTIPGDFDARAIDMDDPVPDSWEEDVRALHLQNIAKREAELVAEYGTRDSNRKRADFIAIGVKPFSVLGYHNSFFTQARHAFVQGAYYPALLSACALGERTLNHLILDLRGDYAHSPAYEAVADDKSFSSWKLMISTLEAWNVLDQEVADLFRRLARLRHRAVHFNPATYANVRHDALEAITALRDIIDKQFGAFGRQRWYIEGTLGACFIKRAFENDPFVKRFIASSAVYVGPLHGVRLIESGVWQFVDWPPEVYGDAQINDEQYRELFNKRDPSAVAPMDGPFIPATILSPEDVDCANTARPSTETGL
jgi:hypothetical protein